jgi:hypothetical protein
MIEKSRPLRSEKHRRLVASMPCYECETESGIQAAHANFGKGMAIKACDSQTFPLCQTCHQWLDQGGELNKEERRNYERAAVDGTRRLFRALGQWTDQVEEAYQRADKYKGEICGQQ